MSPPSASVSNPFEPQTDFAKEAAALDPARLDELDAWAQAAARHSQAGEWRKRGERLLAENQAGAGAHYAYALLLAAQGEREEAARLLVTLCERLAQSAAWPAVAEVARHALALDAGPPAARWLVRAIDETGDEEARFEALIEAHAGAPGEARLAWRLARLYEARGNRPAALQAAAQALDALARRHDAQGMEDALLVLLEEPQADYLRLALPPLPLFAKGGEVDRVAGFFELAWPALRQAGLAREAWQTLRDMLLELPDSRPLWPLVPEIVEAALPQGPGARSLLEQSGFRVAPASEAIALFERLLPFAPGSYAEHGSWGVGRVVRLATEELWIDFPGRPGHRMTLRAAHQALVPRDAEDLAVLGAWQPERLAELLRDDPVSIVARALARLGTEAAAADLKRVLTRYAVPESEWTSFWNSVKGRLAGDRRIDANQAYRGRYRLAEGGAVASTSEAPEQEAAAPLPRFDRGADARKVLATLRRFLAQHPDQASRLARERSGVLKAWRDDEGLAWRERMTALLFLGPSEDETISDAAPRVAGRAFSEGFELRELPAAPEQRQALEWGLASPTWEDAARSGIGSRFADVRDRAFDAVLQHKGNEAAAWFSELARRAAERPEAGVAVAERAFGPRGGSPAELAEVLAAVDPWECALGLGELLEAGTTDPRAKTALTLLSPQGPLARAARPLEPKPDDRRRLERLIDNWRGSDRGLLPFLEWLEAVGLVDLVAPARDKRRIAARAITADSGPVDVHEHPRTFLTRATYDRLRREAEALDQALKTEIPAAIQKAREHGDLRENAEYESAKLKQRQTTARLAQLARKLEKVSFIDDLEVTEGTVGLGSEVELELSEGGERRLWILGEGDDHLGPEVVSYRAPLGRALMGKKPGEIVELPGEGSDRAVVRSVRPRLPLAPAARSESAS